MAFEALVIIVGLVVGWIKKGSIWHVANVKLKLWWMLPAPYILQHISIFYLGGWTYRLVLVISYILIVSFCLLNRRVPGVGWALAGTLANFVALAANGLRMPAYIPAIEKMAPQIIPALQAGTYGKSIAMSSATHLNFLGDIFAFNVWPGSLMSIGDILFSIGLILLIQYGMTLRGETVAGKQPA